jgi:trehalose 6-phosphate synthase
LHIPFPAREQLASLPQAEYVVRSLLAYDLVGFNTAAIKQNFLDAVRDYVPEAEVHEGDESVSLVRVGGRIIRVGNFPISIDANEFRSQLDDGATQERIRELKHELCEDGKVKVIFDGSRLDFIKGLYEELLAFDLLLEKHPELVGKIVLCQLVVPSREFSSQYREYKEKIVTLAEKINEKYRKALNGEGKEGGPYGRMPVRQIHAHMARSHYTAYLHVADIQSIPTLVDSMNLVAKEGAVAGKDTMVQVLGKDAGAAVELGEFALLVDPRDTEALADTLYAAYAMDEDERRERKEAMAGFVTQHDVYAWWGMQEPVFQEIWDEKAEFPQKRAA